MQYVTVIATGRFIGREGTIARGQRLVVTEERARELESLGVIERMPALETKPAPFALEVKPFSPRPAQASEPTTSNTAAAEPSSSASTTPGASPLGPTPSTPATPSGGTSTPEASETDSAASAGRRARRRRRDTD